MLTIESAKSGYGASQVLFGVDLQIGAGQVVTLLGRNGMGKTTLLRTLFGQLPLRGGKIQFAGQDISGWSPDRIARVGMAIVPEGRQCFPNLTVREHLTAFVAARNPDIGEPWTPERVFELFPRLHERARNMGNQLSGGEQQMLAIGRALMTSPKLLLLDEPSIGLAPIMVKDIFDKLPLINARGITILLVEQDVHRSLSMAARGYVLEHGEIVMSGPGAELLADEGLRRAYLGV